MLKLEDLLSDLELLKWSIIPKADITVRTHFAIINLERILDKVCG